MSNKYIIQILEEISKAEAKNKSLKVALNQIDREKFVGRLAVIFKDNTSNYGKALKKLKNPDIENLLSTISEIKVLSYIIDCGFTEVIYEPKGFRHDISAKITGSPINIEVMRFGDMVSYRNYQQCRRLLSEEVVPLLKDKKITIGLPSEFSDYENMPVFNTAEVAGEINKIDKQDMEVTSGGLRLQICHNGLKPIIDYAIGGMLKDDSRGFNKILTKIEKQLPKKGINIIIIEDSSDWGLEDYDFFNIAHGQEAVFANNNDPATFKTDRINNSIFHRIDKDSLPPLEALIKFKGDISNKETTRVVYRRENVKKLLGKYFPTNQA